MKTHKKLLSSLITAVLLCSSIFAYHYRPSVPVKANTITTTNSQWSKVNLQGMGWVTHLKTHPDKPNEPIIGTDVGGAYRFDAGASEWLPLLNWRTKQDRLNISSNILDVAFAPGDANHLYAATGDVRYGGGGSIWESIDNGANWTLFSKTRNAGLPIDFEGNAEFRMNGPRLTITDTEMFTASKDGLLKWNLATKQATLLKATSTTMTSMIVDGQNIWTAELGVGLWYSANGGSTWAIEVPTTEVITQMEKPDTDVYMSIASRNNQFYNPVVTSAMVRRAGSWINISPSGTQSGITSLAVNPLNQNELYLGYMSPAEPMRYSSNGGSTWTTLNYTEQTPAYYYPCNYGLTFTTCAPQLQGDMQWIGNTLWLANGYGVFTAPTATSGTITFQSNMKNLEELVVTDLSVSKQGALFVASWDMFGYKITDTTVVPTTTIYNDHFGKASSIVLAPSDENYVYAVGSKNSLTPSLSRKSTDGGNTWSNFPSLPNGGAGLLDGTITVSSSDPNHIVWTGVTTYVNGDYPSKTYVSRNGGTTWVESTGLPTQIYGNASFQNTTLIADPNNGDTFYLWNCGPENNWKSTVYKSIDGGNTFAPGYETYDNECIASSTLKFNKLRNKLILSPDNDPGHIKISADGGQTFSFVNSIDKVWEMDYMEKDGVGVYYAIVSFGSNYGLYKTADIESDPDTWEKINPGSIGLEAVQDIAIDPTDLNHIFIGNGGEGVWEVRVLTPITTTGVTTNLGGSTIGTVTTSATGSTNTIGSTTTGSSSTTGGSSNTTNSNTFRPSNPPTILIRTGSVE
jgi:hypothetical protein